MKSEVDRLIEAPGILAASKTQNGSTVVKADATTDVRRWQPLLATAEQILTVSREDEAKIALSNASVVVMRSGDITIGLVVVKSHPVVKSLKRMVRRAFKRLGSPTKAPAPRQPSITTTPVTPSLGNLPTTPPADDKDKTAPVVSMGNGGNTF